MFFANQTQSEIVYMCMSEATRQEQQLKALKNDYRRAWRRFLSEAESLRQVMDNPASDPEAVRVAKLRTDEAASDYRQSRDALAALMLECDLQPKALTAGRAA